ncbi:MAG: HD domain-containing protein [Spirochaetales bacterium]|nr:HD domain-containing protein [Spirochaetales bacterium]
MAITEQMLHELEDFARSHMVPDILHGWPHITRVLHYAGQINLEVNGEWDIIKSAVLLHDIGHNIRTEEHNYAGARLAGEFLESKKVPPRIIGHIKECIITHSRQFSREKPQSREARVLYDADGMDLFGPIGLMRALLSCGLKGKGFDCMIKKLKWRLSERENFFSQKARLYAREHSAIIEDYLEQLKKQLREMER